MTEAQAGSKRLAVLCLILCLPFMISAPAGAARAKKKSVSKPATASKAPAARSRWPFPPSGLSGAALAQARKREAPHWLFSPPLFAMARGSKGGLGLVSLDPALEGKRVLLSFFDYTNLHCTRLVPYLSSWRDRYARSGLVVVGVHAPEFPFAADARSVAAGAQRLGIRYPVYLDSDFLLWRLFSNQFWPRSILILPGGQVVYDHVGETGTEETEIAIRTALGQAGGKTFDSLLVPPPPQDRPGASCKPPTSDTYAGRRRGRLASPGYPKGAGSLRYRIEGKPGDRQDGSIYLTGTWRATDHALIPDGKGPWELRLKFHGTEATVVLTPPPGGAARVEVALDDRPVPERFLTVDTPRMFTLVANQKFGTHEIALSPTAAGIGFHVFRFGGCEAAAHP